MLFRWIPPLMRTSLTVLLAGLLVGYVGTGFVTTIVADTGLLGGGGESPDAHKYMVALLERESESLTALRPQRDVVSRALEQQQTEQTRQSQDVKTLSLTYLGGSSAGRISVHIYAVEMQQAGRYQFFPVALTIVGGKVIRLE